MKVLITGNLGYVGPGLIKELRNRWPHSVLCGFDTGFFAKHLTTVSIAPELHMDLQYYGDVRNFNADILNGVDVVVSLAAISNDPIGNKFEKPTMDINYVANVQIAKMAKAHGVQRFIFASSCSVYGAAEDEPRKEDSALNPLTAYAKSKIYSEEALEALASSDFQVTCLRFATACGMSDRLRLDLVLNDFVAGAIASKVIDILSDGSPWRPLIHVRDMARAIAWAAQRKADQGGSFLTMNTGSNAWNYQVKELAYAVKLVMPDVVVKINEHAAPDKRSYRVNFDLYERLAPGFQPQFSLADTIKELKRGLGDIGFSDPDFRKGQLMRLNTIKYLRENEIVTADLRLHHEIS
jgi:nucleoside-diphosphate-sugar epimerase